MSTLKYHTAAVANAKKLADAYFPTHSPLPPAPSPVPTATASPTPQAPTRMSKLAELAAALNDIPRQVEADADAALTRLLGAKEKASSATGKIHNVAGKIEETAQAIEDFANQITNGGPTGPL